MQTIPIHALLAEDGINPNEDLDRHPRDIVSSADVVLAQDVMSGRQALVYGRTLLETIAAGKLVDGVEVLAVELDMDSTELETLVALVQVVKGRDDYQPAK
jgi:hypothetical protein